MGQVSSSTMRVARRLGAPALDGVREFISKHAAEFSRTQSFEDFYLRIRGVESARLARLWRSVVACVAGDEPSGARDAEALLRALPDEDDGAGALALRTFGEAMLARASHRPPSGGNLYLEARPPGAQLRAFELLRLRTPLIPFAYAAGNRALLDVIEPIGPVDLTLIDVGIGRGAQVRALLRNPVTRTAVRSLHVVGVEPDHGALELAERGVMSGAREIGLPTTFTAIARRAEELDASMLEGAGLRGIVLANCAFTLHHVLGTRFEARNAVLRTLRSAGARAVVLVEPDTNHHTEELAVRFLHAYRHYRTVASVLSASLSASNAALVWSDFFAPEVLSVLAHRGADRVERHEELDAWAERLAGAGFRPQVLRGLVARSVAPPGFEVRSQGWGFRLCFRGTSLLGVLRANAY